MTLPPVARRSLALLASTALLLTGAAGTFTGTALAANPATVTSVTPSQTNNSGGTQVTVSGTGFATTSTSPSQNLDTINFALSDTSNSQYGASTPTLSFTPKASDTPTTNHTDTTYVGTLTTTNAPPGFYDVYDTSAGVDGSKCLKCFYIGSSGAPDVASVLPGSDTCDLFSDPTCQNARGPIAIDINGRNLAKASKVNLLLPNGNGNGQPDPGTSTAAGAIPPKIMVLDKNNPGTNSGYASSGLLYAEVVVTQDNFTPGKHLVTVTNTNIDNATGAPAPQTGAAGELWLPKFISTGVSPTSLGAGATNRTVTIVGQGIRQGSRIVIQNLADPNDPTHNYPDNSVGAATVSPDGTTISAPVTIYSDAMTNKLRAVSIVGPDGGLYTIGSLFNVNPAPKITSPSSNTSGLSPSKLGQGGTVNVSITGTGFAAGATVATSPVFTFSGTGLTATTRSSTNLGASIAVTADSNATLGSRTITVTNPDGGSSTYNGPNQNTAAFTVDAGPTIASVVPANGAAGTSKSVTIKGMNFDSKPTPFTGSLPTVQFSIPPAVGAARQNDSTVTASGISVTKGVNGAADTLTFTVNVAGNAVSGLRDLVLTNTSDNGAYLCSGCFGVDSLTNTPTTGANTGTKQVTFTAGTAIPSGSTVRLSKAGDATVQPDIAGGSLTSPNANSLSAIFDLTDAATGPYNAIVTTPSGGSFACSSCFTVTGLAPTFTSINPAAGGQGAVNRAATITGTNFSRGMKVTITDTTVHDVVFISRTQIAVKIDIPTNAPTGAKDVVVTNNDASQTVKGTGAYTVSAPPTVSSVSPTSLGQGANGAKITVTGPGYVSGSTPDTTSKVDFGPGITVTSVVVTDNKPSPLPPPLGGTEPNDTLVATVNIDENAPLTVRDVTVTNPDGGVGTLAQAFTVNPGPKVTGISPSFLPPGGSGDVTITGAGFSTTNGKTAVPTIAGVTLSNVTVDSATSISATAAVDGSTGKGAIDVVVTNPTDSGAGTCTGCFFVAVPPGPPVQVHTINATANSATVAWTAPSDNGGAPITSYVVSAKDPAGRPAGTPGTTGGSATAGTVSNLVSGVKYTISVIARNVAGDSTASTTLTQTTGVPAQGDTILTSSHSPSLTTTGQSMTLFGKLIKSTGTAIGGATIELALAPDVGSATFPRVTTNSGGAWSYTFNPIYSYTIKTLFRGDGTNGPTQATTYRMGVSTRVTVTSPANGARSSVRSPLVVRGGTSPNKGGSLITLYRYSAGRYIAVQNVRVAGSGTYAFSINLARGDYVLKVGIGRAQGNFVGYSPAFGVHRR